MSRVKQWPQDAYARDGPDSSPMPMRQRALNLEGDCHVPHPRRPRLEARPLGVARSIGEPEGNEVGGGEDRNKIR